VAAHHQPTHLWISNGLHVKSTCDWVHVEVSFRARKVPGGVENRRIAVVSQWLVGVAFAWPPQSGLAWLCFLFPLIEPDVRSYRIRLGPRQK
jgi:hypothetical protein